MPVGVGSLGHIGRRGLALGVGVRVIHTDELAARLSRPPGQPAGAPRGSTSYTRAEAARLTAGYHAATVPVPCSSIDPASSPHASRGYPSKAPATIPSRILASKSIDPDGSVDGPCRSASKPLPKGADGRPVAQNRRARHDYDILETYEAGIVLVGSEVKSLREGKAQLRESFARVIDGEVWLYGMHLPPYTFASGSVPPILTGGGSCCCTTGRSPWSCGVAPPRTRSPWCRCRCTSRMAGPAGGAGAGSSGPQELRQAARHRGPRPRRPGSAPGFCVHRRRTLDA